ncbi:VOC family protein [Streptomyces seoulensis]
MAGHDIAYVEVYAKDKQRTAQYLVSAMGFACLADSVGSDRSSLLLRRATTHLVVTSGPATWKFLDAHGDGVADIALLCTDVDATAEEALRAGAREVGSVRGNPILTGAGGVTHTLLPAERTPGDWPAGHRWAALPQHPAPTGHVRRLEGVAIGIGATDLEEAVRLYRDGFGLAHRRSRESGPHPHRTADLGGLQGGPTLTLLSAGPATGFGPTVTPHPSPADRAVQRLSFEVADIARTTRELIDSGAEFDTPVRWEEPGGHRGRLSLVGRSPHLGATLLLELVQHGDPADLGAGLRDLYQAVDRRRLAAR